MAIPESLIVAALSPGDVIAWAERWSDAFDKSREAPHRTQFMWHTFSFNIYPSTSLDSADSDYAAHSAHRLVLFDNDLRHGFLLNGKPSSCEFRDWYIFPENLAWTFVKTHEDGWIGPFFAKNKNYATLELENVRLLKKAAEAAAAREKGWA